MRDSIRLKLRAVGKRKSVVEQFVGDSRSSDGTYKHVEQLIDRQGDLYHKRVADPTTDEVIRYCEGPLSQHRDCGSAKTKKAAKKKKGA